MQRLASQAGGPREQDSVEALCGISDAVEETTALAKGLCRAGGTRTRDPRIMSPLL